MKTKYKQCSLQKLTQNSSINQISWIPEKYAKIGYILKLKLPDNSWEDGWKVLFVGDDILEEAIDIHKAIRLHRKNTGDSLKRT